MYSKDFRHFNTGVNSVEIKSGRQTSAIIMIVALVFGVLCSVIMIGTRHKNLKTYRRAAVIRDTDSLAAFLAGGNGNYALVEGDIIAIDPVSVEEIVGQYMSIRVTEEAYKETTDTSGATTYDWEEVSTTESSCQYLELLGAELPYDRFEGIPEGLTQTLSDSNNTQVQYEYAARNPKYTGTTFLELQNGTVSRAQFYNECNSKQVLKQVSSLSGLIALWGIVIIIVIASYSVKYLSNERV
ncbi:MAG: hypothetical protein IJ801_02540 [Lachnospiraceae bacterium]|nr:hypothetical protein [Lachnospiraceae bacterium]